MFTVLQKVPKWLLHSFPTNVYFSDFCSRHNASLPQKLSRKRQQNFLFSNIFPLPIEESYSIPLLLIFLWIFLGITVLLNFTSGSSRKTTRSWQGEFPLKSNKVDNIFCRILLNLKLIEKDVDCRSTELLFGAFSPTTL